MIDEMKGILGKWMHHINIVKRAKIGVPFYHSTNQINHMDKAFWIGVKLKFHIALFSWSSLCSLSSDPIYVYPH
jgi:hypothetical protein